MSPKAQHTRGEMKATVLKAERDPRAGQGGSILFEERRGAVVGHVFDEANAAEIVRRWNAHEELVAALEDLLARCGGISPLAGVPSVKAVRDAGKLLASMDAARAKAVAK